MQDEEKKDDSDNDDEAPIITLKEYCKNLHVESETVADATYWFIDWTDSYVKHRADLFQDIVLDYCQPVYRYGDLQSRWMGLSTLSERQKEEPLAVRTVSIRIRPDTRQETVLDSVRSSVLSSHKIHSHILKSTSEAWVAILGGGNAPVCISAMMATHQTSHHRRLFLRFYALSLVDLEAEIAGNFERIFSSSKYTAPPTRDPRHQRLVDACLVVQHMWKNRLQLTDHAPGRTHEDTSLWFRVNNKHSKSVEDIVSDFTRKRDCHSLFPSLAQDDMPVLNESFSLVDSIWDELQRRKCTYDTIAVKESQFGQRPCRTTLDKGYCWQLAQISNMQMLRDLQPKVEIGDSALHDTHQSLQELQIFLVHNVLIQTYRAPVNSASAITDLETESAPVPLPSRKFEEFPWNPTVRRALKHVTEWTSTAIRREFDPKESVQLAEQSVRHVATHLVATDDADQKHFIKERNLTTMKKVEKGQEVCKTLLNQIQQAPQIWKKKVPKLQNAIEKWQDIGRKCAVNPIRSDAIPLLEIPTKMGQCCITRHQFVLQVKVAMLSQVYVFDYKTTDVRATPNHPLTKLAILENGKKVAGCNPDGVDVLQVAKLIETLKSLLD